MSECEPNLPMVTFVKRYGQHLPLRVRVEEGFYGSDERSIISSGEMYNFHFIRNEKIMCIEDSRGAHFSVPFNSAISFGLIYNPSNEPIHAVRQYSFTFAGEIITSKCPPRIIRATKEFKGRDSKSSVFKDEILIVKGINQNRKKRKEFIRVQSLLTGEEKLLYRQCEGHFLTDPGSVRLYLPEIAQFFHESLPILAKLFINSDVTDDSVSSFASEVVKMTHTSVESAIIATSWNAEETGENEQSIPIAIPVDLNIEVSVQSQPGNNEDLYQMTRQLFEGFYSSMIKDMKRATTCTNDTTKTVQRKLKGSVRKGHERQGVEVEKPTKAYQRKSKIKNIEPKMLEFNQLPSGTPEDDNRLRERRVPSISYSTFISEPKYKPISFSESPAYSCGNSQMQSCPSVDVTVANADEPNRPLSVGLHPPFGMESVSQSNSNLSTYDTPKKVVSRSLTATLVLDNGTKMKPIAIPCMTPSHQSLTPPIKRPTSHNGENKSVPSHNRAVSIASETTYDVPRKNIEAAPFCEGSKTPRMPKYDPLAFGSASNEHDSRGLSFALAATDTCTCISEKNKPLSEMIKSHPLLKHQQVDHNRLSYENTPLKYSSSPSPCSGCKVAHGTTLKSDVVQFHNNAHQQGYLSRTVLESSTYTPTKHNDVTCQGQTIQYSQVVSASMNRAQTLIARNIQELKQLDCDQMLTLLENINLSQYKQSFHCEGIDGEILAECDEDVLLHELHVSSQAHRNQLMNIITGKQSVTLLLSGQGIHNYVRLGKENN